MTWKFHGLEFTVYSDEKDFLVEGDIYSPFNALFSATMVYAMEGTTFKVNPNPLKFSAWVEGEYLPLEKFLKHPEERAVFLQQLAECIENLHVKHPEQFELV